MSFITWNTMPGSSDYNTPGNWSPGVVPGGLDAAFFGASKITDLIISQPAIVGEWVFAAAASHYTFTINTGIIMPQGLQFTGEGIIIDGGTFNISVLASQLLGFYNSSSAATAFIDTLFGSLLFFADYSTAGNASIMAAGFTKFSEFSTAGSATIHQESGSAVFLDNSNGGTARFIADASATVNFSGSTGPANDHTLTAGSIEGAGTYDLGSNRLTVGLNGRSSEVSGHVDDGGSGGGGSGASLVKVGKGSLKLSGADNTYSGGTTLKQGTLDLAAAGAAGTGAIAFAGKAHAKLTIENAALTGHAFFNPIDRFGAHDVVDLSGLHFHAGAAATYHKAHHLRVHSGHVTDTLTLISPHGTAFAVAGDGHGGTDVFLLFA
jgi:autotransporter-associated beta strand protein